jgi:uncharacterized protein (TIGR03435 family)
LRALLTLSAFLLTAYGGFAQSTSAVPAFEVASVKVSQIGRAGGEGSRRQGITAEPGSLNMRNVSMMSAIAWAWGVPDFQVSGPAWLGSERYQIVAKAAGAAPEDQLKLMLQGLLADRFKLAVHREEKVMAMYVLTVAKGGPKFQESTTEGEPDFGMPGRGGTSATLKRIPMSQVVSLLQNVLQAPVIDETGLKGRYDATLNIGQYIRTPMQIDEMPSIVASAVQDLLGLKLESKKGPVDMVIVDRAEKVPTEN